MLLSRAAMLVAPQTLARSAGRLQVAAPVRRLLSNQARTAETRRAARRATLGQRAMAPAGEAGERQNPPPAAGAGKTFV